MNKFFANKIPIDTIQKVNELFFQVYKMEKGVLEYKSFYHKNASVDINTYIEYLIDSGETLRLAYFRNIATAEEIKQMAQESKFPFLFFSKPNQDVVPCLAFKKEFYSLGSGYPTKVDNLNYYLEHILTYREDEPVGTGEKTVFITCFPNTSLLSEEDHVSSKNTKLLTPIERFFKLLSTQKREIVYIYIYAIFAGLITLAIPLGIQSVIGFVSSGEISTSVVVLISFMVLAILISGGLQIMQLHLTEHIQQRLFAQTAFEFSYRFPKIKMEALKDHFPPELVNRFFDVLTLQKGLAKLLLDFSTAILQVVFGLILLSLYHYSFIFFGIFLVVVLLIIIRANGPKGLKTSLYESKYKYQLVNWLQEIARAHHTFKWAGYSNLGMEKTDHLVSNYINARKSHFKILMSQYFSFVGFKTLITGGLLVLGCVLLISEEINLGQFVASEIIIILIMSAVEKILIKLDTVYDVLTSAVKIGQITDLPLEKTGVLKVEDTDENQPFHLQVKKFGYRLPQNNKSIFKDINLEINSGERVAISGLKETGIYYFVNSLMGILPNYKGVVAYNHISLRDYSSRSLQNFIATNSHEKLFDGSLLDNISLGKTNVALQDVLWAIKLLKANDFILSYADGLHSQIVGGNNWISKKDTEKLILARCLARKPKFLIFDNFLPSVNQDERIEILEAIMSKENDWTLLFISNDPEILERCERTINLSHEEIEA